MPDNTEQFRAFEAAEGEIENEQLVANRLAARQEAQQARIAELAEEQTALKNQQVPMSLGIFVPLLFLCVIGDFIDVITGGTIGWLIGLFIDAIILIVTGLSKAGRKQFKRIVIGLIGETIPIIDILPFRSIFLTWGFIKSRSSIAQALSEKIPVNPKVVPKTS